MTYDVMGYGWGMTNDHYGSDLTETYRLPQTDGTMKTFDRISNTTSSKEQRQQYFAAFKATYNTEKTQASSLINLSLITPSYTFSHTEQNSSYIEEGYSPILNGATDNTNQLKANLKFNHDFGKQGNLLGFIRGTYENNRTHYFGTATSLDKATYTIGFGKKSKPTTNPQSLRPPPPASCTNIRHI